MATLTKYSLAPSTGVHSRRKASDGYTSVLPFAGASREGLAVQAISSERVERPRPGRAGRGDRADAPVVAPVGDHFLERGPRVARRHGRDARVEARIRGELELVLVRAGDRLPGEDRRSGDRGAVRRPDRRRHGKRSARWADRREDERDHQRCSGENGAAALEYVAAGEIHRTMSSGRRELVHVPVLLASPATRHSTIPPARVIAVTHAAKRGYSAHGRGHGPAADREPACARGGTRLPRADRGQPAGAGARPRRRGGRGRPRADRGARNRAEGRLRARDAPRRRT